MLKSKYTHGEDDREGARDRGRERGGRGEGHSATQKYRYKYRYVLGGILQKYCNNKHANKSVR